MRVPVRAGDTQALPGYVSFYMQLQDPNSSSSNRWDCFASYKLAVLNQAAPGRDADLSRESWHRFSSRPARQQSRPLSSSSHGWADFASAAQVRTLASSLRGVHTAVGLLSACGAYAVCLRAGMVVPGRGAPACSCACVTTALGAHVIRRNKRAHEQGTRAGRCEKQQRCSPAPRAGSAHAACGEPCVGRWRCGWRVAVSGYSMRVACFNQGFWGWRTSRTPRQASWGRAGS